MHNIALGVGFGGWHNLDDLSVENVLFVAKETHDSVLTERDTSEVFLADLRFNDAVDGDQSRQGGVRVDQGTRMYKDRRNHAVKLRRDCHFLDDTALHFKLINVTA